MSQLLFNYEFSIVTKYMQNDIPVYTHHLRKITQILGYPTVTRHSSPNFYLKGFYDCFNWERFELKILTNQEPARNLLRCSILQVDKYHMLWFCTLLNTQTFAILSPVVVSLIPELDQCGKGTAISLFVTERNLQSDRFCIYYTVSRRTLNDINYNCDFDPVWDVYFSCIRLCVGLN